MLDEKPFQAGMQWIQKQVVLFLKERQIHYEDIRWSRGREHYRLTVKLPSGTRFARFAPICLLDYEGVETKMVITFLLKNFMKKFDKMTRS